MEKYLPQLHIGVLLALSPPSLRNLWYHRIFIIKIRLKLLKEVNLIPELNCLRIENITKADNIR